MGPTSRGKEGERKREGGGRGGASPPHKYFGVEPSSLLVDVDCVV